MFHPFTLKSLHSAFEIALFTVCSIQILISTDLTSFMNHTIVVHLFNRTSDVVLGIVMSAGPPLWSRLKYVNGYKMDAIKCCTHIHGSQTIYHTNLVSH